MYMVGLQVEMMHFLHKGRTVELNYIAETTRGG